MKQSLCSSSSTHKICGLARVDCVFLREHVAVHLSKNADKFNLLVFMVRKLYALAAGRCSAESADSPMNQEILLGGHLYLMILKVLITLSGNDCSIYPL